MGASSRRTPWSPRCNWERFNTPDTPMASDAEHFHFLEILAGTYDSSIKNMRIADNLWNNTQFIAAFPVERVPKHPLSGISTRSGDLARFTFKGLVADRVQRMYIHLLSYQIVTVSGSGVSCSWTPSSPDMSKAATMAHPCEHCSFAIPASSEARPEKPSGVSSVTRPLAPSGR